MPRQSIGVVNALNRRQNGSSFPTDQRNLLHYVEEKTASSCHREKNCELSGTPRSTFLVCFSHDRSKMASTHGDHTIRVVNSFTGNYVRTLRGHPRTPWCVSFHPSNNNLLASGCLGGEVRIWDLMGGCEVYTPPDRAVIASISFHPIDHVLLIATSNKIYFWQWEQPQPFACLQTNYMEEKVRLVKFSPFGDYILTGITNCSHAESNTQQNRTQASVDQVLQSVSCTQLDSDQVTEYIMQQTGAHAQRGQESSDDVTQSEPTTYQGMTSRPSSSQPPSTSQTATSSGDAQAHTRSEDARPVRNYRGVFALFRARDSGGWNIDTSEIDSDPTDVSRSNVLFSSNATESMSVDRVNTMSESVTVDTMSDSRFSVPSSSNVTVRGTTGISEEENQDMESGENSRSSSPATVSSSSLPMTSSFSATTWSSSITSSSSSSMSSSSSTSSVSSSSSSSSLSSRYSDNTSSLANILQEDQNVELTPASTSGLQENILNTAINESVVSASGNEDVSQSISFLNPSNRGNDVSVAMTSSDVAMDTNDYRPSVSSTGATVMETSEHRSRSVRSSGVNVQIESDSGSSRENPDRYVSGVGSVVNVGAASSRTSYVAHGNNHSSSLSTLSHQEGSGTAIATATARTFRHVHTAVVIANGNEGGPQIALRTAINRAIAGAFAGSGEGAVASNIINTTHRLQWWDFSKCVMPDIKNDTCNVIVPCCKIHNDASCDLSSDGTLLAAFVPSALGFPDDGMLAVYSMKKDTLGQCLYTKKFGPNAISVSISPLNSHVVVGLAARRIQWHLTSQQVMAQVFKLIPDKDSDYPHTELKSPVQSIALSEEEADRQFYTSVNAAFWHPVVGCGLVYGTNRGDLRMRVYGPAT